MNVRQAMESMHARRAAADGLPAVYRRQSALANVTVTRARSLLRLSDASGGSRTELWDSDFTLLASALLLDGEPTVPRDGDTLDVTEEDGRVHRYELQSPTPSEKCYTAIDSKVALRIHTKFVKRVLPT